MPVAEHLRGLVESFSELVSGHIALFKVELHEDAKVIGTQVGKIAGFAPLLLVGYGFLCVALALFLRRWIAADLAFLLVGLANVVGGGLGIYFAAMKLKNKKPLNAAIDQLEVTRAQLTPGNQVRQ